MNSMKQELEDLGFANLYPWRYRTIKEHLSDDDRPPQESIVANIETALRRKMNEAVCPAASPAGRNRPTASTRRCWPRTCPSPRSPIFYAFRIITQTEAHCYLALGAVHSLYQPKPGRFKDFIALPKANGYQSLHTILNSPFGLPVEIQIRTEEMDMMAEQGRGRALAVQGRWQITPGESGTAQVRAREWLMQTGGRAAPHRGFAGIPGQREVRLVP